MPSRTDDHADRALSQLADDFLIHLAAELRRSPNTIQAYRRDLRSFESFLDERDRSHDAVTAELVVDYVRYLEALDMKSTSINRALVAIKSMFRFGVDEGLLATDPTLDVKGPKPPRPLPKALTEAQIERLFAVLPADRSAVARRDRAILEVLYGTGVRVSELVGMSIGDVDFDTRFARVVGKGSKERAVPVGRSAFEALADWMAPGGRDELVPVQWRRRSDAQAVFLSQRRSRITRQGVWDVLSRYARVAGLGDVVSPHVLRHSCATHMLEHGADLRVVQELLGHASVVTTQIYTRVTADHLLAVYEKSHPRALVSGVQRP